MSRAVLISARGGGSGGAFGANRIVVLFTVSLLLVASAAASFFAFCPASSRSIDETKVEGGKPLWLHLGETRHLTLPPFTLSPLLFPPFLLIALSTPPIPSIPPLPLSAPFLSSLLSHALLLFLPSVLSHSLLLFLLSLLSHSLLLFLLSLLSHSLLLFLPSVLSRSLLHPYLPSLLSPSLLHHPFLPPPPPLLHIPAAPAAQHQRQLQQEQQEGVVGNFSASQPSQQGQQQVNGASEGGRGEAGDGSGGGGAGGAGGAGEAAAGPGEQEEIDENQPPETSGKCPPSETIVKHSLWHASGRYFHSMGVFPFCSMDACFNYSRCPADPSHEPLVYFYWPGQHYFKRFNETRWHTDDPAKACFFFVHMARGQPNEFTDLEHWGENGANHVLISFSDSWSGPSPFGVSSAMVMVTNAQATIMRTDFDTSIPLPQMWKNPPVELRNLPAGSARKYFLTFRGTRYLGNLKGNFRSAPEFKALHNGKDVVVLTRCGGSTNARILAEEPSLKPECDEDAKLYTQYDFADIMNTTFTLAPAGRQGSTYRFLEALTVGAIPVVVADNWRLPFDDIISWHHCLLRFPTDQMHRILPTLRAMDEPAIQRRQKECVLYADYLVQMSVEAFRMKRSDEKRAKSSKPSKKKVKTDSPSVKSSKKPKPSATATDGAAKSSLRADDDTWKQRASIDKDLADRSAGSDGDAADGAEPAAAGAAGKAGGGEAGTGDGYEEMTGLVLRNEEFEDGNTGGSGSGGVRCLHEVAYPKGWKLPTSKEAARKPLPEKPAKEYPFKLDPFQEEAVRCLEANESVLVSAHTSAGKTVVAEYAIAMAMRDNQRVVYTSPIKPLPLSFPPPTHSPPLTAAGISTHISRQDCGGGIRDSHGDAGQPVRRVHIAHQGAEQPKHSHFLPSHFLFPLLTLFLPFPHSLTPCVHYSQVSAHTSAGKTVVAEYAIAMAMRDNQRVVYTSPIKALSNQKFREMSQEFGDVGLMTGDVTIAPNATCLCGERVLLVESCTYTSPIKALSNQKFREMNQEFGDVGLMTGDVTIAPNATYVVGGTMLHWVMTTEILRSMLYRGSDFVREVGWIIFDEVHYLRDKERGVVWEESIVMAPKSSRFVFLSATVPNAREFAEWVAKVHQQPCHIVYTDYRPTPLQHYIFPAGGINTLPGVHQQPCHIVYTDYRPTPLQHYILRAGGMGLFSLALCVHQQPCHIVYTDYRPTPLQHYIFPAGGMGLFLAVDEKGKFREASFQKAMNAVEGGEGGGGKGEDGEDGGKKGGKWGKGKRGAGGGGPGGAGGGGGGKKGEESDIYKIVKMIMQRQYDPVIVFSFSRADCEALALQMSRMDLNDDDEKTLIDGIFRNAIDSLAEEDKKLPQVNSMLPLLRRGIGIHHSGLLPLLKEVIEILFQEGLLKCLFATETFSIGLNMPAKTVVFTNVRKWDGTKSRWLSGGEYIQMSGRAGRRGLDDRGICILMVDSRMEPAVAKGMVKGSADPLVSRCQGDGQGLCGPASEVKCASCLIKAVYNPPVYYSSICILMVDSRMDGTGRGQGDGHRLGMADPFVSAFHLSYNFILNQLRSPEVEIEQTIRSSYRQFQSDRALPALQAPLQALEAEHSTVIPDESSLLGLCRQLSALRAQIRSFLTTPYLPQSAFPLFPPSSLCPPSQARLQALEAEHAAITIPDESSLLALLSLRRQLSALRAEIRSFPTAPPPPPALPFPFPVAPFSAPQARLQALEAEHSTISIPDESSLLALLSLRRQLSALRAQIRSSLTTPSLPQPNSRLSLPCPLSPPNRRACKHWKRSIQQSASLTSRGGAGGAEGEGEGEGGGEGGEAGVIGNEEDVTVWGVVVNFKKVNRKRGVGGGEQQDEAAEAAADVAYDVDILTRCVEEGSAGRMGPPGGPRKVVRPCRPGEEGGSPLVASFPLTQLDGISAVRLFLPKDLKHKEPREAALKSLQQLLLRAGADGVQMLDPEEDMEVNSPAYRKAVRRAEALEALIASHALASAPDLQVRVRELARKSKLKIALKVLKKEVKAAGGLILKDELKARMRVLRRLEYIDEDEIVRVKGRVACEISSADELVVTELLFSAALADLPPETVAALLSCCVWQEKGAGGAKRPRESLQGPLAQLREIARRIARVQEECKIALDVETYVASFRPDIMEAVFGWCHGAAFADVLAAADTFEGSLIRAMRRLEELLQEAAAYTFEGALICAMRRLVALLQEVSVSYEWAS
ncbi:unnamed protein product [Closterium sp. NIES-65]|nr:unnamed protein product [Closterium sp. NIES-65]